MRKETLRSLVGAACALVVLLTLNLAPLISPPPKVTYSIGDLVVKDLYAPISFPIPKDSARLAAEQDSSAALVLKVVALKSETEGKVREMLRTLRVTPEVNFPQAREGFLNAKVFAAADSVIERIFSQGYLREKEELSARRVVVVMNGVEIEESLDNVLGFWDVDTLIENSARRFFSRDREQSAALTDILRRIVLPSPNLVLDEEETEARIQTARSRVSPYEGFVERGELIADAHSRIDEQTLKKITALNTATEKNWKLRLQLSVQQNLLFILFIFMFGLALYLAKQKPSIRELLFLTLVVVVGIVTSFALRRFSQWWFVPTGFAALAVAIFTSPLNGVLLSGFLSIILFIPWQAEPEYFLYAILVGAGAIMTVRFLWRRLGFIATFGFLLLGGLIARATFLLTMGGFSPRQLSQIGISSGINASLNLGLLLLAFVVAERLFGFASNLTLGILTNLNHPLFKEFALKAAGSYHHSIVVGNLAERAAGQIGANPILALAGGYYHDIGKMLKPQYFIENQLESENPHNTLKPRISALILASHVKEGLVLAERYRLPRPIREIIAEHQGTTRMEFFYRKHLESQGKESMPEEDFRYPGPKPKTKEAALVMLADSVEAAVRAQGFADRPDLERLISMIFEQKVEDGQLDECAFTTADIQRVEKIFAETLLGIFHPRISYEKKNNARSVEKDTRKVKAPRTRKKGSRG